MRGRTWRSCEARARGSRRATARRYLDFGAGIAVCALGHSHPHLVEALKRQGEKLWHVSNLFRIPEAEALGRRLVDATFADYVFFTNSGAEAVEGAIKTARKYHAASGHPERFRLITFEGAFHGRTLATIAAGGNPKYIEGFGPKVEGFDPVPFGDIEAVKAAIGPETAGVLVEPIQGEGGVRVPPHGFLRALRDLCDERGILLVLDEVQSGMGRTGKLFAHELYGVDARHHGCRQGHRRRLPARRVPGDEGGRQGHGRRHARHDLWRQSAGHERRRRGARRHHGARLHRRGRAQGPALQAEARGPEGPVIPASSPKCAARACCWA